MTTDNDTPGDAQIDEQLEAHQNNLAHCERGAHVVTQAMRAAFHKVAAETDGPYPLVFLAVVYRLAQAQLRMNLKVVTQDLSEEEGKQFRRWVAENSKIDLDPQNAVPVERRQIILPRDLL